MSESSHVPADDKQQLEDLLDFWKCVAEGHRLQVVWLLAAVSMLQKELKDAKQTNNVREVPPD